MVGGVIGFFHSAAENNCSDGLTNNVMDDVATAIQDVQDSNFTTLGN